MSKPAEIAVPVVVRTIAARLAARPEVAAIAIGGSRTAGMDDGESDLDLYIFADPAPPLAARAALADEFAVPGPREIGSDFWGQADFWLAPSGEAALALDLGFFAPGWMAEQIDRVVIRNEPSLGYSTSFWHTVSHALPLYDRDGWFARLQARAATPYPEPLRRAIIAHNHPVLRTSATSLTAQIALAVRRDDPVSIQHRTTALLASYFDIVFALNRLPHPGEKRLLRHARERCALLPDHFARDLGALLAVPPGAATLDRLRVLIDSLDALLAREGLLLAVKEGRPEFPIDTADRVQ